MKKIVLFISSFRNTDDDKLLETKSFNVNENNYQQTFQDKKETHNEIESIMYGNIEAIVAFIQVFTHGGAFVSIPLNRYFKLTTDCQYGDWHFDPEWRMTNRFKQKEDGQHKTFLDDANNQKENLKSVLPIISKLIKEEVNSIHSVL